jgi:hypothetical protein
MEIAKNSHAAAGWTGKTMMRTFVQKPGFLLGLSGFVSPIKYIQVLCSSQ